MHLSSGIDWFELHGSVEFGESRITVPKLLAALKRHESTVLLDDGSYGMLPEEWLEKYGMLAGLGTAHGDHVRFNRNQAGLLDALLASQPEVSCDELFERLRTELRTFGGISSVEPPSGISRLPAPLSKRGVWDGSTSCSSSASAAAWRTTWDSAKPSRCWRCSRSAACCATPGRSADRLPPSLVVMPRSLVFNWRQEAGRFTPELRILEHTGGVRIRGHKHFDEYDAVFTTYGTLRRDAPFFKDKMFDYVILDEAQAIKNASTESAKAARLLRGSHRLALSGTPIENHLGELWSLFEFLNPGMLGSASVFKLGKGSGAKLDDDAACIACPGSAPFHPQTNQSPGGARSAGESGADALLPAGAGTADAVQRTARSLPANYPESHRAGWPGKIQDTHPGSAAPAAPGGHSSRADRPRARPRNPARNWTCCCRSWRKSWKKGTKR